MKEHQGYDKYLNLKPSIPQHCSNFNERFQIFLQKLPKDVVLFYILILGEPYYIVTNSDSLVSDSYTIRYFFENLEITNRILSFFIIFPLYLFIAGSCFSFLLQ